MNVALLVLRLVVGGLFFGHGAQKLFGWFGGHGLAGTGGFFETIGFRPDEPSRSSRRRPSSAAACSSRSGCSFRPRPP